MRKYQSLKQNEMKEQIEKIEKERQERCDELSERYGKMLPIEELKKRHNPKLPLNPITHKHREAIWLIDEIYRFYEQGRMSRSRSKELIAGVIDEHFGKINFNCIGFQLGKTSQKCIEKCRLC